MRRLPSSLLCMVFVVGAAFSTSLFAQEGCPLAKQKAAGQPAAGCEAMCPMMKRAEGKPQDGHPCCMMTGDQKIDPACAEAMKAKGITPGTMMGFKIRASALLSRDDPPAALALKSDLGLTPEQVEKLEALQKEARARVMMILNDEQKKQLAEIPDAAKLMDMCRAMMQQMIDRLEQGPAAQKLEVRGQRSGTATDSPKETK